MIMKSEGLQCQTVGDCDRRLCRVGAHVVCNNHKCTCARGSYIGGPCSTASTCDPSGCPPNNRVVCDLQVCKCIPN